MTDKLGKAGWLQGAGSDFSKARQQDSKVAVLQCGRSSVPAGAVEERWALGKKARKLGSKQAEGVRSQGAVLQTL